jgi:DNA-binding NarL/FixJ family response regulator
MSDIISVLIADDHPSMRESIRVCLEKQPSIRVVGEAGSVEETMRLLQSLEPTILILDMDFGPHDPHTGVQVLRKIQGIGLETKVIVWSGFNNEEFVTQSIQLGAKGYLMKYEATQRLMQVVFGIAWGGEGYFSDGLRTQTSIIEFSEYERILLRLLILGLKNDQMEKRFVPFGVSTINDDLTDLFRKIPYQDKTIHEAQGNKRVLTAVWARNHGYEPRLKPFEVEAIWAVATLKMKSPTYQDLIRHIAASLSLMPEEAEQIWQSIKDKLAQ